MTVNGLLGWVVFNFIRLILLQPIILVSLMGLVYTKDIKWIILAISWLFFYFIYNLYILTKSADKKLKDVYEVFFKDRKRYSFTELSLNHINEIANDIKRPLLFSKYAKRKRLRVKHEVLIRIFVAKKRKPPYSGAFKSYAIWNNDSYVFLPKDFDYEDPIDRFLLYHEIGHCSLYGGQKEWTHQAHLKIILAQILVLIFFVPISFVFAAIILFTISSNYIREKESPEYLSETLADRYALNKFIGDDVALESIFSFLKNKYSKEKGTNFKKIKTFGLKVTKYFINNKIRVPDIYFRPMIGVFIMSVYIIYSASELCLIYNQWLPFYLFGLSVLYFFAYQGAFIQKESSYSKLSDELKKRKLATTLHT